MIAAPKTASFCKCESAGLLCHGDKRNKMKYLLTRADDFGSVHSANVAIFQAAQGNYLRNISCMAVGPAIRTGAPLLRQLSHLCLGMHATLNSEWNKLKWIPCAPAEKIKSLLTASGTFPAHPSWFLSHPPDLNEILLEFNHQLDYLTRLHIPIQYVDMHMMPYREIPGLDRLMSHWIKQKGLLDHTGWYQTPVQAEPAPWDTLEQAQHNWSLWLDMLPDGVTFQVTHPCKFSPESLLMENQDLPGELVARRRDAEYRCLCSGLLDKLCRERAICTISYRDAYKMPFARKG